MRYLFFIIRFTRRFFSKVINSATLKMNNVDIFPGYKINGNIYIKNSGSISIGKNFIANSSTNANPIGGDTVLRFMVKKSGKLIIGDNVGISNSTFVCWNKIEIGDYVYIGGSCKVWDTDFHSIDSFERRHNGDTEVKTASIKISKYAFIGGNSIILKGVNIGENSIIAAGSVVTRNIPENEIWGGNPAKFIRKINT